MPGDYGTSRRLHARTAPRPATVEARRASVEGAGTPVASAVVPKIRHESRLSTLSLPKEMLNCSVQEPAKSTPSNADKGWDGLYVPSAKEVASVKGPAASSSYVTSHEFRETLRFRPAGLRSTEIPS